MALPQGLVEREGAVGRPGDRDALDFKLRHKRGESLVVAQLALRLRVKMHGRRPAARQQQRVDRSCLPAGPHGLDARRANHALDFDAAQHFEVRRRRVSPAVENFNLCARLAQRLGDRIDAVVVGRDRNPLADENGEAAEIDERSVGRHDPRTIIVGHDQRALDGAGRDNDRLGPYAPQRVGKRLARRSQAQTRRWS